MTVVLDETFIGKKKNYPLARRKLWNTNLVQYDSNLQQTNEVWSLPQRQWGVVYKLLSAANRLKLIEAFDACRGRGRFVYISDNKDYSSVCSWTQTQYAILSLSQSDKTFTFAAAAAGRFQAGWQFKIVDSTGNDGVYTIVSSSQTTSSTTVIVEEAIPHSVADGNVLRMYFLLHKVYYSGESYAFTEPKKDIVPSECTVTVGVSPAVTQVEGSDYSLVDTDGIIKFVGGSTPADGVTISASFQFYYRAMFSSDAQEEINIDPAFYDFGTIWLTEIKRQSFEA